MPQFSPYVTVYDLRKDPPVGELVYRASLPAYLKNENYTTERPANAVASPNLRKTQLPTAQREQNRQMNAAPQVPGLETGEPMPGFGAQIPQEKVQTNAQKALAEIEPTPPAPPKPAAATPSETPTDEKPKRSQPRRRGKADAAEASTSED